MKIVDIRATTVTVPLEAPLRHASGAHWGRFVRTIVEVEADNGLVGLGELGGGGESAEAAVTGLREYLVVHGHARVEEGGAADLLQRLAHTYMGPDVEFPPGEHDPAAGYVLRIVPQRAGGAGPWAAGG